MSDYDVVVVGAGVAGAIVARHVAAAGHRVLVLEAGGATGTTWVDYQANVQQYLASSAKVPNSPYSSSPFAPSPSVLDISPILPGGADTQNYFVQRGPQPFASDYLRSAGGTTLHWLGTCLRMVPNDFRMASRYRRGIDWPLSYEDLEPEYERAERELGVAADVEDQRYLGITFRDGYVYPMHRIPPSWCDQRLAAGLDHLRVELDGTTHELQVTSTPQARNSTPNASYDGGLGYQPVGAVGDPHRGMRCEGNSSCIPICPVQAKYNALKTLRAPEADSVVLETQAVVSRIELSADGSRVTGVVYETYDANQPAEGSVRVTAEVYVLAASAIENAKILLMSGAAPKNEHVGRHLMDHPFLMTWAQMPESVGAYRGPSSTSGIEVLRDGTFRRDRAAFRVELANWGWDFCAFGPYRDVEEAVHGQGLFGSALRDRLATTVPRQIRFGFLLEQLPRSDNQVTISRSWLDAMGNPRPILTYHVDDYTRAGMAAAKALSDQAFAALGATQATRWDARSPTHVTYQGTGYTYSGSGHVVGTHRMSSDRDHGVVTDRQRSWDHDNLYVVGCGSMPTIATSNPTLTMAALCFRTVDQILDDLGREAR